MDKLPSPPGSSATRTKLIDIGVFTVELARDFAAGMSRGCMCHVLYLANHTVKLEMGGKSATESSIV
jgi:hypothetical protein